MAFTVGSELGPYQILTPIGSCGMGEVYRAHDPRLNRNVAIKVSNAQFTERFTREATAIAAPNHTNICHLLGMTRLFGGVRVSHGNGRACGRVDRRGKSR
jgi:serine/threonine protein kinase